MKKVMAFVAFAGLVFAAGPSCAAVSAVSSNAISLDAGDWSSVRVDSVEVLRLFNSTKPCTVIFLR